MRTALDTNVMSGLLSDEPLTPVIVDLLGRCRNEGPLIVSAVVYAELLAYPKITEFFLNHFLEATGVEINYEIDESVWIESGRRFALYADSRRQKIQESPRRLLADFVIGAHALATVDRLITFDQAFFRRYFPELLLYPSTVHPPI